MLFAPGMEIFLIVLTLNSGIRLSTLVAITQLCLSPVTLILSKRKTTLEKRLILRIKLWVCIDSLHGPVCQLVSELFRKVQDANIQQKELGWRGKGLRQQPSTAASHFLQSLTDLTTRLERYQLTNHTDTELFLPKLWLAWKPTQPHLMEFNFTACAWSRQMWFVRDCGFIKCHGKKHESNDSWSDFIMFLFGGIYHWKKANKNIARDWRAQIRMF